MGSSPGPRETTRRTPRKSERSPFERRVVWFLVLLVLPGLLVSGALIWLQPWTLQTRLSLLGAEALACVLIGSALREHIVRPLQTLANVVGSLRESDYSFRARMAAPNDALGELSLEVNALADLLAQHRTGAIEASALLERVVEEVDLPIFAFDPSNHLRLVSSAGEKLLQRTPAELLGRTAAELELESCMSCENESLVSLPFASGARWLVRRSSFRQQGVPHTLVVLSDVSRALREEERLAWQRLIRVIGHELNNSLTPIKSIAGSLSARVSESSLDAEERGDFERGLGIIETRAASLNRFLQAYRQMAQMPAPVLRECSMADLVRRAVALETRAAVTVIGGPEVILVADPDQLEQMLINLLRNAAEAILEPVPAPAGMKGNPAADREPDKRGQIVVMWKLGPKEVTLTIEDDGPGLMNPGNTFVPFYTTKAEGSGIGLVLSRQIAHAHGGSLELSNRVGGRGCCARVSLPIKAPPAM